MKITHTFSYFNGLEFLMVQRPQIWQEITDIFSKIEDVKTLSSLLLHKGWTNSQAHKEEEQDFYFVKDRVAIYFQLDAGNAFSQGFAQQLIYYINNEIDVGVHVFTGNGLQKNALEHFGSLDEVMMRRITHRGHTLPAVPLVLVSMEATP